MNEFLTESLFNGIVHFMNNKNQRPDDYKALLLLDEISRGDEMTQRDLSKKLGVALGLINSYVKNLVSKGYLTISKIPKQRYKYYLTPSGFAEKTRLTFHHLHNFTNLYKIARGDFHHFFQNIKKTDVQKVVFCGVDEVTEIAYLSLTETNLTLSGIIDDREKGKSFFGVKVRPTEEIEKMDYDIIVITSFLTGEAMKKRLLGLGIDEKKIYDISAGGWLNRIGG